MRHRRWTPALLLSFALIAPALADSDHDRARRALDAGQVLPLPAILTRVAQDYPGKVLEVELEDEDMRWIYEIKLVQPDGRLLKLEVDAADARILKVRGKRHERSHR
ncbi:PepSY domain-containing protein [Denitromonas iodatirespirans]|uniref:PepSY domain-containing protein n=1 Tax=Denitromonas iodatirespirans TaxID=2795389 RepID=A0A944DD26_DENI1|nr:PepSY domain-containing protein [Denitromonas iodatirespirans]MBT0962851.1 PepSY domain-containing protein [Denitromonas iodatirespirans]